MRKPAKEEGRLDSLGRRIGFVRQPTGRLVTLAALELKTLEWMHRHGDLSTPFVHRFNTLMGSCLSESRRTTSYRLRNLFHETRTPHRGAYIDWPHQQVEGVSYPDSKYRVHRPSKHALTALKEHGLFHANTPSSSSSWWHDFLRASYTASIELACLEQPEEYRFIHHDTVVNNAIAKTGAPPVFKVGSETFNPDVLFGIRYNGEGKVRLFAVEIDMMTESIFSRTTRTKTIRGNLLQYRQFIKSGRYKQLFAFGGRFCLIFLTVNAQHARNIMRQADGEEFFLFNSVPEFTPPRRPPAPMPWLFTEPYDRPGHAPELISAP
jgi:hypothetical protein